MKTKENNIKSKFCKNNTKGISLIVLVITIIVIIILAAAVILTLNNNNPISEANKARYESDVANMQAIFTNTVAKVMAQNQGTIEVNAGELNSIKTGDSSAEGRVNYTVNSPIDSNNENGTIIFNTGTNNATTYYTGRMLPIYSSAETTWYVDSEGVISLKVGEEEYGKGEQVDNPAVELKEEIEITASNNPMLQSWASDRTTDFHNSEYINKITKVKFATVDKVPGNRIEAWDVSQAKNKSVMAWIEDDRNNGYILTIAGKEKIIANTDSSYLFSYMTNLKEIENLELLNTINVTKMWQMFRGCNNLVSLNLSNFKTSNVNNMSAMFMECSSLTSIDLSNFNTSKVTVMGYMFHSCSNLENLDLSSFNTTNVTSFLDMFSFCINLKNLTLGNNFNFTNRKDIQGMFQNCNNLTTTINFNSVYNGSGQYYSGNFLMNAATIPPAKITINYTLENEGLVDSLINNKGESNLVKGIQLD